MTDPYAVLHDNGFSWDDVNAIAAIFDQAGFEVVSEAALSTAMAAHFRADGVVLPPLVDDGRGYRYATPDEFARTLLAAIEAS